MREQPITETMKISEVKQQLNSLVNRVYRHETRVMVEKSGIPVAASPRLPSTRRRTRMSRSAS